MKRFSVLTRVLIIALILSACGVRVTQATPTINPVDLQSTMLAAAAQMVLETQAAIPTSTPVPTATLTNTPVPTATFLPPSTLEAALTLNPGGNPPSVGDPCIYNVLPDTLTGEKIKIRIDNPTRSTLMVSVNLQQSGPQSLCGYRSYSLRASESLVINDLIAGCYTVWAWNPDPQDYFMVTNGTSCLDTSTTWTFDISTSSIKLRP